jgi:hypothetical protein
MPIKIDFQFDFSDIITSVISGIALVLSILAYRRQRSFDNENHFFQVKLENYSEIIGSAAEVFGSVYDNLQEIEYELSELLPDNEVLHELCVSIEDSMDDFRIALHRTAGFMPKEIVAELDDFFNTLYDLQFAVHHKNIDKKELAASIDKAANLEDQIDSITNLMREDLGIEIIDRRLKRRSKE